MIPQSGPSEMTSYGKTRQSIFSFLKAYWNRLISCMANCSILKKIYIAWYHHLFLSSDALVSSSLPLDRLSNHVFVWLDLQIWDQSTIPFAILGWCWIVGHHFVHWPSWEIGSRFIYPHFWLDFTLSICQRSRHAGFYSSWKMKKQEIFLILNFLRFLLSLIPKLQISLNWEYFFS